MSSWWLSFSKNIWNFRYALFKTYEDTEILEKTTAKVCKYVKSDSKWKAHFHREFTKGAHGLRPHMWPVRTCVRTYARNSKPIWKALYVEWSLEKDPSQNVNFKLWNYPLLNVLFISNQTLEGFWNVQSLWSTAMPHGTLWTWQKIYSVSQNDLSWGLCLCNAVTNNYEISVSWG